MKCLWQEKSANWNKNEAKMKIFTFISGEGNYCDGEYDFMAGQWTEALKMAMSFERIHNKGASNENYKVKLDINRNSVRVVTIRPGFINIRGRKYSKKFTELLR